LTQRSVIDKMCLSFPQGGGSFPAGGEKTPVNILMQQRSRVSVDVWQQPNEHWPCQDGVHHLVPALLSEFEEADLDLSKFEEAEFEEDSLKCMPSFVRTVSAGA